MTRSAVRKTLETRFGTLCLKKHVASLKSDWSLAQLESCQPFVTGPLCPILMKKWAQYTDKKNPFGKYFLTMVDDTGQSL